MLPAWKRALLRFPPLARIAAREGALHNRVAALEAELAALRPPPAPPFPIVHAIEHFWCDRCGVFVCGWIHAHAVKVRAVALRVGDRRTDPVPPAPRPDVQSHYPEIGDSGFSLYLEAPPFQPASLEIATDAGDVSIPLEAPPLSPPPPSPLVIRPFIDELRQRRGRVLEIGARLVSPGAYARARDFEPDCHYVGCDIHPAPGVDLVADAHSLSAATGRAAFEGIFSVAVMEHIAEPWRVAAEINRALTPGGLTFHITHQTFPLHETPNDFWRYSDEAMRILFGPARGFEIVDAGMRSPVSLVRLFPGRAAADMEITRHAGYVGTWVLARKVAEIADDAPDAGMSGDLAERSRAYPKRG
ncbi:class I SAM-dependent methyltransferase [Acidiphilium multivorum]|uniref:class I SAM-dependent methyltransferase n=1 Tax=Acidiphilium multivorum TaxID=62140 RepID=UPI001F4C44D7|nr:class I SAM-dependent methyltransferase [Acidiphilium multivorum]UNC13628.1 class I SAM-dependent methyltransferase [Acidiphilium multivorum]